MEQDCSMEIGAIMNRLVSLIATAGFSVVALATFASPAFASPTGCSFWLFLDGKGGAAYLLGRLGRA
jgi:purine-cytosine permease-like protein